MNAHRATNLLDRRRFAAGALATVAFATTSVCRGGEITITVPPQPKTSGRPRVKWAKGFSQSELDDAQSRYGLKFPPDLIALYLDRRPFDGYNWVRDGKAIREMLDWPFEGLLFDVEHNSLWLPEWGVRPDEAQDRREVLRAAVDAAPKLIPIYSHRFIPEEPYESGNPIFSVHQSDIIYYGSDLADYFAREFDGYKSRPLPSSFKHIRFWSDMVERNR